MASSFNVLDVSVAIGPNMSVEVMAAHFVFFCSAASARIDVALRFGKRVRNHAPVTSPVSGLLQDHGICVASSGRFPLVLAKPTGSLGVNNLSRFDCSPNNITQICTALLPTGKSSAR